MLLHIALPQSIYTTEMGKPTNRDPFPALKSQLIAIYQQAHHYKEPPHCSNACKGMEFYET